MQTENIWESNFEKNEISQITKKNTEIVVDISIF